VGQTQPGAHGAILKSTTSQQDFFLENRDTSPAIYIGIFWNRKPWSIRKAFVGMMLASIDWMKEKEILQLDQFGPRRVKTPPLPALESFPK